MKDYGKKILSLLLCTLFLFSGSVLGLNGEQEQSGTATVPDRCICGREYYQDTTRDHAKYDCTKCGKPMAECTCRCWCGSDVEPTDTMIGSTQMMICKGCGKLCAECTCADWQTMANLEQMQKDGKIAIEKLPVSQSTAVVVLSFILILFTMLCFVLLLSGDKRHTIKRRQRKEIRQQSSHQKILDKIETQAETELTVNDYALEDDAIKNTYYWGTKTTEGAIAAYELTNALNTQQEELPATVSDLICYTIDYIENDDKTQFDAAEGKYGNILKALCKAGGANLSYFDETFTSTAKAAIEKSANDHDIEYWENANLQKLPRETKVKISDSSAKQLLRLKKEFYEEHNNQHTRIIKKLPDFSEEEEDRNK